MLLPMVRLADDVFVVAVVVGDATRGVIRAVALIERLRDGQAAVGGLLGVLDGRRVYRGRGV